MRQVQLGLGVAALLMALSTVAPAVGGGVAEATIHEIVAASCSNGQGKALEPPGQSDPTKHSFVRALQATGVIASINTTAGDGNDVMVTFDASRAPLKYESIGSNQTIPNGFGPGVDLIFVPGLEPSADFAAFQNCANVQP
jgi:hypothetical protein